MARDGIVARANKLVHLLDGQVVMELTDHDAAKRSMEGLLAIQIHRGPAMCVEFIGSCIANGLSAATGTPYSRRFRLEYGVNWDH